MNAPTEVSAYTQAVSSGQYARVTALHGKYDHVRHYWEDHSLQAGLQPHLHALTAQRRSQGKGLRVADLGCGSGDGMETLLEINDPKARWSDHDNRLIKADQLDQYTGLELNPALLQQAQMRFGDQANTRFIQADLREGLPFDEDEQPYDLYAASFGTLSHFDQATTVALLSEIARHAAAGSLFIGDWLGRFSYEWTDLWNDDLAAEHWMDYRISYIYSAEERATRQIDSFGLRLLSDTEVRRIAEKVTETTGIELVEKALFDRSMFVGRHMDTADYNPHAPALRGPVNRLHEPGCRTDLEQLRFEVQLPDGFDRPGEAIRRVGAAWNQLVDFTIAALDAAEQGRSKPDIPSGVTANVRQTMAGIGHLIEFADELQADDPRADWIEPQLALGLRSIEAELQAGCGCGHGLVGVYEIRK